MDKEMLRQLVRRERLAGVVLLAIVLCASAIPSAVGAVQRPAFCRGTVVRDYEAPLRKFPPVHRPPRTEEPLHFGPPRLTISSQGSLLVGRGRIGLVIEGSAYAKTPHIPWEAEVTLRKVNGNGRVVQGWGIRRQRHTHIAINSRHQLDLSFLVGGKPAYYRVDTYLSDRHRSRNVHYAQYFRVLRRSLDVRLRLEKGVATPGETFFARMLNYGTVAVYYQYAYSLEQYGSSGWEQAPFPRIIEPAVLLGVGAGGAVKCDRIVLPATAAPGTYRVRKDAGIRPKGMPIHAHAVFTIG